MLDSTSLTWLQPKIYIANAKYMCTQYLVFTTGRNEKCFHLDVDIDDVTELSHPLQPSFTFTMKLQISKVMYKLNLFKFLHILIVQLLIYYLHIVNLAIPGAEQLKYGGGKLK